MNQEDAVPQIDWGRADLLIELALNEDLDTTGDVKTASVVPEEATATAVGIDDEFGLVVEDGTGNRKTIRSGEVSVRGLYGYV